MSLIKNAFFLVLFLATIVLVCADDDYTEQCLSASGNQCLKYTDCCDKKIPSCQGKKSSICNQDGNKIGTHACTCTVDDQNSNGSGSKDSNKNGVSGLNYSIGLLNVCVVNFFVSRFL
ncbi:hypothetical protein M3Y97_00943100 [Aphelenchoides bicaudatus]|nr:hypothetical protein M3Y97_00943100 [Aphelenchoides bicaudatus]